jgi:Rhodopirellula transposase DDE domain
VTVGTDHDTSAFAVQTLRRWWDTVGRHRYPHANQLLICADGGGSNGYRIRAWKIELAKLAADTGLQITVCHLPPGTSKWNKIEHRLFSQITMNWRGRPLTTHQTIIDLISNTTTTTGLTVHCVLDTDQYPTGIKYTKKDVDALPITRHDFHGEWNYCVRPPTRP